MEAPTIFPVDVPTKVSAAPTLGPSETAPTAFSCLNYGYEDCPLGCVFNGFLCLDLCSITRLQKPQMEGAVYYTESEKVSEESCEHECINDKNCWVFIYHYESRKCQLCKPIIVSFVDGAFETQMKVTTRPRKKTSHPRGVSVIETRQPCPHLYLVKLYEPKSIILLRFRLQHRSA